MQNRLAHQIDQFLKDVLARALGGVNDGGQGGIGARSPVRAETAEYFAMNDRRPQGALTGVVIRRDIRAFQEYEQMLAVGLIARLQFERLPASERSGQQAVETFFQAGELALEARRGQLVPAMTEVNGRAEDVLQFVCPP